MLGGPTPRAGGSTTPHTAQLSVVQRSGQRSPPEQMAPWQHRKKDGIELPASVQCVGPLLLDKHGGADVDRFSATGQCATAVPLSPVPQGTSERVASSSVFGIGYAHSFWSIVLGYVSGVLHL